MTDFNSREPEFDPGTLPEALTPPSEQRLSPRQRSHVLASLETDAPVARPARGRGAIWAPILVAASLVVAVVIGYQALRPGAQAGPGATGSPSPSALPSASQAPSQTPSSSPEMTPSGTDPVPEAIESNRIWNLTGAALAESCLSNLAADTQLPGSAPNYKIVSTSPDGLLAVAATDTYFSVCDGFDTGYATILKPLKRSLSPTDERQFYYSQELNEGVAGGPVPAGQVWNHFYAGGNAQGIASVTYEFNVRLEGQSQTVVAKATIANGYWTMSADAKFKATLKIEGGIDSNYDTKVTVVTTSGQTKVFSWTAKQAYDNLEIQCRHANHGC